MTPATASESRALTGPEESSLKQFAHEQAGIEAWLIRSSVLELQGSNELYATVVFQAADHPDYCLAPATVFVGKSGEGKPPTWRSHMDGRVDYRFWFHSCDEADLVSAVTLNALLDFDVLEKINNQQETMVSAIQEKLAISRNVSDPLSAPQLASIDLRYDTKHGLVYHVKYLQGFCSWLSADVVFDSKVATVIETHLVAC